ncbi:multiple epidermal growth factor-like domains protein 6 [Folsomia candida]|uniref:multiple epidermal growth factor-like domains protein 6 n=1 Tax=Folsomia candida TaxID=158441 RepID=UPI001604BB3F|nr:multiple epidermal growth factor-like domains protein 6 [Folsomia candida]
MRNSTCDLSSGTCVCPTGMTLDYDAASCRFARIGENCSSSVECDQSQRLTCGGSGSCVCDPDKTVRNGGRFSVRNYQMRGSNFDVGLGLCLSKVGTFCKVTTSPNSYYAPHPDNKYCVEGARCSHEGECLCENPTWQVTRDKICGKSYNETCSILIPCSDHLVCTNLGESSEMRCLCPNEAYQIYDASVTSNNRFGSCRGLTHTPCDPADENSCVENAHCAEQAKGYKFLCQCKPNADQKCAIIKHGEPCDYSKNYARCDNRAGLQCRILRKVDPTDNLTKSVSSCSCPNINDVYDAALNKCVSQIGVACSESKTCGGDATCLKPRPDANQTGKCGCKDYLRVVMVGLG